MTFHNDKSQIIRGLAIIFMIILHTGGSVLFKICVPLFTFLVGYGYNFAKQKNLKHGVKRIWHLLSYFWLILLGIFLPIGIVCGHYHPSIPSLLTEMFGLESHLNWYSWYVYFYIFAMILMPVFSRIIDRLSIIGGGSLIILSLLVCFFIRNIHNWSANIWLQAIFDSFLCTPVMISGYWMARYKIYSKIKTASSPAWLIPYLLVGIALFGIRHLPYMTFIDFLIIPVFIGVVALCFEISSKSKIYIKIKDFLSFVFQYLGKESMNMWFLHALFFSTYTISSAILINWVHIKFLYVIWIIILSYIFARLVSLVYNVIKNLWEKIDFEI